MMTRPPSWSSSSPLRPPPKAGEPLDSRVVLSSRPTADVTIALTSSDTGEGLVSPAFLTFTPADWNVPQEVTVTGVDDPDDDGDIPYTIELAAATSADPSYDGLGPETVELTNVDDDTAGITVTPTSGLATSEAGGGSTFTVVLNSRPTADVSISVTSSNTAEGVVSTASLVFTPFNWNVPQTVSVVGVDDPVDDDHISYTIVLSPASSADPAYNAMDPADVVASNADNDTAGVSSGAGLVTTEAGGTASFSVVLSSRPTAAVTFAVYSGDPTEGNVSISTLTFTPANWNTAQSVTVSGVDDFVDDGDITYAIFLAPASSVDPRYNGLDPADVSVTNVDDDTAGITVTPTSGLVVTEAGGSATFTVSLTSQPTADVTINLSSSDAGEGGVNPSSLTFTPANWNIARTVTVAGVDDFEDDGDITFTIIAAPAVSPDSSYQGRIAAAVWVTSVTTTPRVSSSRRLTGLITTEAGGVATFTVVLRTMPMAIVTIPVSSSDPTEGTVSVSSLTFTLLDWFVPRVVTITGRDDDVDDGDVAYSIVLGAATGLDLIYRASTRPT